MAREKMTFGFTWDQSIPNFNPNPEYQNIFFRAQENYFNDRLKASKFITVNDVADALGFERSPRGMIYGWGPDEYIDINVSRAESDGMVTVMLQATNIYKAMNERDVETQNNQPIGTVVTIGHPANGKLAVRVKEGWRYLDPYMRYVDPDDFRAGWDFYDPKKEN